jgi:uncharacterized protein (TIGR03435 family)
MIFALSVPTNVTANIATSVEKTAAMILKLLSGMWPAAAARLGDHLWQSTLFAVDAGLLTLALRQNHARARYWLWLTASIKFLIPFSLLIGLGSGLAWLRGSANTGAGLNVAMEQFAQPFAQPAMTAISRTAAPAVSASLVHWLPGLVTAMWLAGFLAVLGVWCARWRRSSSAVRQGSLLREGREVEALRRLECEQGAPKPIEMRLSRGSLEPGIFGIARPILLWPQGVSEHLDDAHLEAILAHELRHVHHRDNLTAAIHMVVEAIFWFHPLVWWLGARLLEEREIACDEEVLESGRGRQVYAESILKVCKFCVGLPLACVSGVTGADLKKRIVNIMNERIVRKIDFSRKFLLSAAALAAVVAPIVFGLAKATPSQAQSQAEIAGTAAPGFESASIEPAKPVEGAHMVRMMYGRGEYVAANVTLQAVIQEAYGVQANQIVGAPDWLKSATYDIDVKLGKSAMEKEPNPEQMPETRRLLQAILAERLKLALHRDSMELRSYALVVAENGPKMQPAKSGDAEGRLVRSHETRLQMGGDQMLGLSAHGLPIDDFTQQLSRQLGSQVVNKTGLTGSYDFNLQWKVDPKRDPMVNGTGSSQAENGEVPSESSLASLSSALREQLGLDLQPQNGPVAVLVIDHVEKPSAD